MTCIPTIVKAMLTMAFAGLTSINLLAQCVAAGPLSPGTATNDASTGSLSFINTGYTSSSDNLRSSATALAILFDGNTNYLKVTNFGFNLPPSATICGIQVQIEKSASSLLFGSTIRDDKVHLVKNNVIQTADNKASGSNWTGTESYRTHGSNSDIWNNTWMPSDINSSGFGVAISANIRAFVTALPSARINHIQMTVYYIDVLLPIELKGFFAKYNSKEQVELEWETTEPEDISRFTIQQSMDDMHWENRNDLTIQAVAGTNRFRAIDPLPTRRTTWYRLQLTSTSGKVSYSAARKTQAPHKPETQVFPNPFTAYIQVSGINTDNPILITDSYGREIRKLIPLQNQDMMRIEMADLPPGIYYLVNGNQQRKILKNR